MRNLRQKHGRIVANTTTQGVTNIIRDKKRVHFETITELFIHVGRTAHGQQMYDVHVTHTLAMLNQCIDKMLGLSTTRPYENMASRLNLP